MAEGMSMQLPTGMSKSHSPFTIAVSSPGSTLSFSPTWTMPPHILPETDTPELCLLKTLDTGILRGTTMSRTGGVN